MVPRRQSDAEPALLAVFGPAAEGANGIGLRHQFRGQRICASELIEGIEEIRAWKRGEVKLKSTTVELPRAADVPQIRKALGYSQEEFAALMGVSVGTLRNWEQARREPHGPARSLLLVAATNPAAVRGAFERLATLRRQRRFAHKAAASKRSPAA